MLLRARRPALRPMPRSDASRRAGAGGQEHREVPAHPGRAHVAPAPRSGARASVLAEPRAAQSLRLRRGRLIGGHEAAVRASHEERAPSPRRSRSNPTAVTQRPPPPRLHRPPATPRPGVHSGEMGLLSPTHTRYPPVVPSDISPTHLAKLGQQHSARRPGSGCVYIAAMQTMSCPVHTTGPPHVMATEAFGSLGVAPKKVPSAAASRGLVVTLREPPPGPPLSQ